jgi:CrcB protein
VRNLVMTAERFLWVCLAGALGTGARYAINVWLGERAAGWFPWATLVVNAVGCFLIAMVAEAALNLRNFPPDLRLALTT